jgi:heat shock protein HslJ
MKTRAWAYVKTGTTMRSNNARLKSVCLLIGCCMSVVVSATPAAGLAGSEWRPLRLGQMEVEAVEGLFVRFEGEGRLTGYGGCNRLFGSYEITGEVRLLIGALGATRRACPEPLMAQEQALRDVLERARRFGRKRFRLVLFGTQDEPLAEFVQTDAD